MVIAPTGTAELGLRADEFWRAEVIADAHRQSAAQAHDDQSDRDPGDYSYAEVA